MDNLCSNLERLHASENIKHFDLNFIKNVKPE